MPSHQPPPLLVLSNGHGEDVISLALIEALKRRSPELSVAVLPLVGTGEAFAAAERRGLLQRVGPQRTLPSGGFSNQSLSGLLRDLGAGLLLLSWRQWRLVRAWGRRGHPVLAVGDLLPLLLAWSSGSPYGFLGTPKSDYTWASAPPRGWGASPLADAYHRCKGSEWDPWEWALMRSPRCRLVAMRDRLTARGLRRRGVAALAVGNPMMDGLDGAPLPLSLRPRRRLLLLPGSRMPEALGNLQRLIEALPEGGAGEATATPDWLVLLATGRQPDAAALASSLEAAGFRPQPTGTTAAATGPEGAPQRIWRRGGLELWQWAAAGLATAGTATEQLVGLGIPALSIPGPGPQFKASFARRQSRLLGGSVLPCRTPQQAAERLGQLLQDPALRQRLGTIGQARMGPAGGSERLAVLVAERLAVLVAERLLE